MEHVVFFPGPGGSAAYRRVAELAEAVALVEHLRNVEGIEDVSVHALSAVPLAFKAYYKVELPAATAADGSVAVASEELVPVPVVDSDQPVGATEAAQQQTADVRPEPVSNGRPAARGLGFFA